MWENAVLSGMLKCMQVKEEEDRLLTLEEMVEIVLGMYTSKMDLLETKPRKGKMESYFAHATTICQEFRDRDMAIITPEKVGQVHIAEIGGHEMHAPVHVIDGKQIGMIHVTQYQTRERIAYTMPILMYAVMASGIDNFWFLSISVRKGANFAKFHGYMPEGRKRWFTIILEQLAESMERGPYPPCHPGVWHCHPSHCQFWGICRGACDAKGRVLRT